MREATQVKGERKIERTFLSLLVGSVLLVASLFPSTFSAPPLIKRPYEIVVANFAGPRQLIQPGLMILSVES